MIINRPCQSCGKPMTEFDKDVWICYNPDCGNFEKEKHVKESLV